jgi:hypothetical protein
MQRKLSEKVAQQKLEDQRHGSMSKPSIPPRATGPLQGLAESRAYTIFCSAHFSLCSWKA